MRDSYRCLISSFSIFSVVLLLISPLTMASQNETQWYALFLSGKKAGFSKTQRVVKNQIVTTTVTTQMEINRAGTKVIVKSVEESVETLAGKALAFRSIEQQSGVERLVTGIIRDDQLHVEVQGLGEVQYKRLPWNKSALLFEGQRLLGLERGLAPGTEYSTLHFMISAMEASPAHVLVQKEKGVALLDQQIVLTPLLTTVHISGVKLQIQSFVDQQQQLKKVQMPLMGSSMEMIESSKEYALSASQPSDFFNNLFVNSPRKITRAQVATTLEYTISSRSADVQFSQTPEQRVSALDDGSISLKISPIDNLQGSFPYQGNDPELIQSLAPNAWVQNTDEKIVALALKTVAEANSATQAAQMLENFVRQYIENKTLSVGYASALQVLQSKSGDCTEHALLLVAMLKAVGIPARVASGVVYVDQFSNREQVFIPHAWAQAYIEGQWVSYDAALTGFNSGHIQLAQGNGDPKHFFSLINTLGSFEIKKIAVN